MMPSAFQEASLQPQPSCSMLLLARRSHPDTHAAPSTPQGPHPSCAPHPVPQTAAVWKKRKVTEFRQTVHTMTLRPGLQLAR